MDWRLEAATWREEREHEREDFRIGNLKVRSGQVRLGWRWVGWYVYTVSYLEIGTVRPAVATVDALAVLDCRRAVREGERMLRKGQDVHLG